MRKRKKKYNRKKLLMIFSIMFVGVIGLTIAYAALSTTLNISGSGEVNSAEWGIVIEELPLTELYGDMYNYMCSQKELNCGENYIEYGQSKIEKFPTVTNTSVKDFSVSAVLPDEGSFLLYKVINKGSIPAKLESVNYSEPIYTSLNNNENDILWAKENAEIGISIGNLDIDESMAVGEVLCPGEFKYLMVGLVINEAATTLPSGVVTISDISVDYVFTQTNDNACVS